MHYGQVEASPSATYPPLAFVLHLQMCCWEKYFSVFDRGKG